MNRFALAWLLACMTTLGSATAAPPDDPFRIERQTILTSPDEFVYFQSRGALIPGDTPRVLVTVQATDRSGSHGYRDVYQIDSRDNGKTWSTPTPIESLRRVTRADGVDLVAGDLTPQWHRKTKVVLATGKTFGFVGGTKEDRNFERVSYCVYTPESNQWGKLGLLEMPSTDHAGNRIVAPNSGCCQRYDLPNGDILLPIRYCPDNVSRPYVSIVALCRFDGTTLSYVKHGSELTLPKGRGLYEPSVTFFQGKYYLTLRADNSAYVAQSDDGLNYEPIREWKFDDSDALGSYNTQQHWVAHSDALYLCYTRRGANNDHIFRHRAPLFIARVDPSRLCVVQDTEEILLPENHAAFGNFGVVDVGPDETWIVESEHLANGKRKNERNNVLLARLRWSRPNQLFKTGD